MVPVSTLRTVWEHWPDTREFITRCAELWNRWIQKGRV